MGGDKVGNHQAEQEAADGNHHGNDWPWGSLLTYKETQMDDKQNTTAASQNEGEGNKIAARRYNDAQKRFAQSGKVGEKARDAEQALDGPDKEALQHAEDAGKRHSAGEDPAVKRKN